MDDLHRKLLGKKLVWHQAHTLQFGNLHWNNSVNYKGWYLSMLSISYEYFQKLWKQGVIVNRLHLKNMFL